MTATITWKMLATAGSCLSGGADENQITENGSVYQSIMMTVWSRPFMCGAAGSDEGSMPSARAKATKSGGTEAGKIPHGDQANPVELAAQLQVNQMSEVLSTAPQPQARRKKSLQEKIELRRTSVAAELDAEAQEPVGWRISGRPRRRRPRRTRR